MFYLIKDCFLLCLSIFSDFSPTKQFRDRNQHLNMAVSNFTLKMLREAMMRGNGEGVAQKKGQQTETIFSKAWPRVTEKQATVPHGCRHRP